VPTLQNLTIKSHPKKPHPKYHLPNALASKPKYKDTRKCILLNDFKVELDSCLQ
jgi:hypothetical protein